MALLFIEGFDHHATGDLDEKWTTITGSPTVGSSYKRNGSNGCELALGDYLEITLAPSTATQGACGVALYRTDSNASSWWYLKGSGGNQMYLRIESDATIDLIDKDNNILASSTATISATQWHYLEMKWTIANSPSGVFQIYLDGGASPIINFTGDTSYQTAVDWNEIEFGVLNGATIWVDDIYILDMTAATHGPSNDDILGDVVVKTVLPSTGNGTNTDFTCSTSTDHGALVDESTPNTSDYVYSSTANHVDTWNFPALSVTGTVLGVQLSLYANKSDSGTRTFAGVARPASTNRVGSSKTPTTSWRYYTQVWDYNPETDTSWTVSAIDASEFGVKVLT